MAPASKVLSLCFLVMFSIIYVGFAQRHGGGGGGAAAAAAAPPPGASLQCLEKLLPCQAYLKAPSNPPPACCVPLNELVKNQRKCLCQVFNNADLLKLLNVTQADALRLARKCHAKVDVSICEKVSVSPSASPATSKPPSNSNSSSPSSASQSAAAAHLGVGASAAISFFLSLLLSGNMGSL